MEQLSRLEEQVKDSQPLLDPAGITPTPNINVGEDRSLPMTESVSPRSLRESVGCHHLPISMLSSTAPACVSPTTLSGFLGSSHTATSVLPNPMSGSVLSTPPVGSMGNDPIPTPVLSTPLSVSVSSVQSANSSLPAFSDPLTTPPVPTPLSFTSPGATMPSAQAGTSMVSTAWLGQQLPPLNAFAGDDYNDSNAETFEEWMERFDLVAAVGRWDEPAKLANLVTRLKGSAFAFFRSCRGETRGQYSALVDALRKRFTPVHIGPVQTSLFHDRKQGDTESVDAYAQDLRHLFHKAYPSSTRGGTDAERIAQTVLSSQFVSGLRSHIKSKVAGHEGSFDELLTRARFEEAKSHELRPNQQSRSISTSKPVSSGQKTGSTSTVVMRPTTNTCQPPVETHNPEEMVPVLPQ